MIIKRERVRNWLEAHTRTPGMKRMKTCPSIRDWERLVTKPSEMFASFWSPLNEQIYFYSCTTFRAYSNLKLSHTVHQEIRIHKP